MYCIFSLTLAISVVVNSNGALKIAYVLRRWIQDVCWDGSKFSSHVANAMCDLQRLFCKELAHHHSMILPHRSSKSSSQVSRFQASYEPLFESHDPYRYDDNSCLVEKGMDCPFSADALPPPDEWNKSHVGLDKQRRLNSQFGLTSWYQGIAQLLQSTYDKEDSEVMGHLRELIDTFEDQVSCFGANRASVFIQLASRIGLADVRYGMVGGVYSKELGPYKFISTVCKDKKMSIEVADRKFQESFQHIHKSNSIYHPDNHDSSLCEGHRIMINSTKKDIVGFTETPDHKLEMMNIISLRRSKSGRTFRSVFVGYHNTNVKHGNLSDVVHFFDDMDSSSLNKS